MVDKSITTKAYLVGDTAAAVSSAMVVYGAALIRGSQSSVPLDEQLHNIAAIFFVFAVIIWLLGAIFSIPFLLAGQAIEARSNVNPLVIYASVGGASGLIGAATLMLTFGALTGDLTAPAWKFNCCALGFSGALGGLAFSWSRSLQLRKVTRATVARAFD